MLPEVSHITIIANSLLKCPKAPSRSVSIPSIILFIFYLVSLSFKYTATEKLL